MRAPLLLTGGPAAGKSTTGRLVAALRPRCAFVDVDDVRQLVVSGHRAPWEGEAGAAQATLGVRNACALVRNVTAYGFESVVADVVTPATAALYRSELGAVLLVHLRLPLAAARARAATRPLHLTEAEFVRLHEQDQAQPPAAGAVLEVTGLSVEDQVAAIEALWARFAPA